jgi:nitroreductase
MELVDALRTTGAVRAFTRDAVPDDVVHRILDSARFAPSGGNKQPWRVVLVKDRAVRARLRDLSRTTWREYVALQQAGQRAFALSDRGRWPGPGAVDLAAARADTTPWPFLDHLDDVPVMLVVLAELPMLAAMDVELDRHGIVGGASIYPFCQDILLAARAEGLGGVLTTFLARQEPAALDALGVPDGWAVAATVVLGHPEHRPTRLRRRPVEAFTTVDRFDGPPLHPA